MTKTDTNRPDDCEYPEDKGCDCDRCHCPHCNRPGYYCRCP